MTDKPLSPEKLCWKYDGKFLDFETTNDITYKNQIVGQDEAVRALEFALLCHGRQQNVYVRGIPGVGRQSLVNILLEKSRGLKAKLFDRCYVHNFKRPDRPRLITLPAGKGLLFKRLIRDLVTSMEEELNKSLNSDLLVEERAKIQQQAEKKVKALIQPFENKLQKRGLQLVRLQNGESAIFIQSSEGPVPPSQYAIFITEDKGDQKVLDAYEDAIADLSRELFTIQQKSSEIYQTVEQQSYEVNADATRNYLSKHIDKITRIFYGKDVRAFLGEVIDDVIDNRLNAQPDQVLPPAAQIYDVNVVLEQSAPKPPPVIQETLPNLANLLGSVDPEWQKSGQITFTYKGITAGSLLRADGGYLVLDVADIISEPGAWRNLMRTLRTGKLEIVPPEMGLFGSPSILKPEAIPINVRVILIGNASYYYQLDRYDSDFAELFKVLADFDHEIPRNSSGLKQYSNVITRIVRNDGLLAFSRDAVIRIAEHGSRIASRKNKITAQFGRISDLCQEASFIAEKDKSEVVTAIHVEKAIEFSRQRAGLPSRKFRELVNNRTIHIETKGNVIGQVNGLAVMSAGTVSYGFPARITATISPGRAGLINIEGTANLSGSIHTKGFNILGGVLRHLLKPNHPLTFSASIAFEQSYGGIDGDSASGVEAICLLSALTEIPVRQNIAMTGAIDQFGNIQAIGGVNEKIEGFFEACAHNGLTGDQGVIIPKSNSGDLNLRREVIEACERGEFNVWAIDRIENAIQIMMGQKAGRMGKNGSYSKGSVLGIAVERAEYFFNLSTGKVSTNESK